MIPIYLQQLAHIIDGYLIGNNIEIKTVVSDTRQFIDATNSPLFIAIKGKNFDGHNFIEKAITQGVSAILVSNILRVTIPQILVTNTLIALGKIAAWVRQQVNVQVIAITGSTGKTTVKEMVTNILRYRGKTLSTLANMNNEIGVPLTLLQLTKEHEFAVVELGANHSGEIDYTVQLTCPDVVLINNIAISHLKGFGSLLGVAKAKGEILKGLKDYGIAIINSESKYWQQHYWHKMLINKLVWNFSLKFKRNCHFFASNIHIKNNNNSQFIIHTPKGKIEILFPLLGKHNIINAIAATALSLSFNISLEIIKIGLETLHPLVGRMFPIFLDKSHKKLLLDDSYNSNLASMNAAIHTLSKIQGYRVMVIGDIFELGTRGSEYHKIIGLATRFAGIDKVLTLGQLSKNISVIHYNSEHFVKKSKLINRIKKLLEVNQHITILIKGSRHMFMDTIIRSLQEQANK
ncbi:MAG: UDP-N-acetylmuramoyl-tripeptide--D-alanyl-D-alanine ligase [Candidatus Dasytiphilus stammeri]